MMRSTSFSHQKFTPTWLPRRSLSAGFASITKTKNAADSAESWANYMEPDHVVSVISDRAPGKHEAFMNLINANLSIVDWRLVMRNPEPKWVFNGGREVQLGDIAHLFLLTSANGATQAMEDAVSLATCLRVGEGPDGILNAIRVHNKLRYTPFPFFIYLVPIYS